MKTAFVPSTIRSLRPAVQSGPSRLTLAFGLAAFTALTLVPAEAQAACREGFCVSGYDQGRAHVVTFTTSWKNVSHFNYYDPFYGVQHELGANQRRFSFFNPPSGTTYQYAIQACNGGFLVKSSCTPWAYFTHKAP